MKALGGSPIDMRRLEFDGVFTVLHPEVTQENLYLLLIQIVSCFLIKKNQLQ